MAAGATAGVVALPYLIGAGALLYVKSVAGSDCYKDARMKREAHSMPRAHAELLADAAGVAGAMAILAPSVALPVAGAHGIGQLLGDVARDEFRYHTGGGKRNNDAIPVDYIVDLGVTSIATLVLVTRATGSVSRALPITALSTAVHVAVHMATRQVAQDGWLDHRKP